MPEWARRFGNLQVSPGRPATAPRGRLKAATVRQAAWTLRQDGINIASQVDQGNAITAKAALRRVPGIGYATANYFLMLLGAPSVKPDRMIHRFLNDATGRTFINADAEQVIDAAARLLGAQPHELDHAIWRFESMRARGG